MNDIMPDGMWHMSDLDRLPKEQRNALMDYADALEDPEYLKYVMGDDYNAPGKYYYRGPIDNAELSFLNKQGFISDKQKLAVSKAFHHGGDASKYINFNKIANNLITDYL